jgi:hypothetical protein
MHCYFSEKEISLHLLLDGRIIHGRMAGDAEPHPGTLPAAPSLFSFSEAVLFALREVVVDFDYPSQKANILLQMKGKESQHVRAWLANFP